MIRRLVDLVHHVLKGYLCEGMTVADCTIGNGQDALFLCDCIGPTGKLVGFDVQAQALEATETCLRAHGHRGFELHLESHAALEHYAPPGGFHVILYNLGYLPGGDKVRTTEVESTLSSVRQALEAVVPGGAIAITVYVGHEAGKQEAHALEALVANLDGRAFHVLKLVYANQNPEAPFAYVIERHL